MREIKAYIMGFQEAFRLFDRSGEGTISSAEFLRCWQSFGFKAEAEEVCRLTQVNCQFYSVSTASNLIDCTQPLLYSVLMVLSLQCTW